MKRSIWLIFLYCLSCPLYAYQLFTDGGFPLRWNQNKITILADLDLNGNIGPLGTHWNEAAAQAASYWSEKTNFKITVIEDPNTQDVIPNYPCPNLQALTSPPTTIPITFSNSVCSFQTNPPTYAFSTGELAVTQLLWEQNAVNNAYPMIYAGIYFNQNENWDIYNGQNRGIPRVPDFRRIAAHEMGHILGLGHDDSTPADRLMTSSVSDVEVPTSDDLAGVASLYGATVDDSVRARPGIVTAVSRAQDFFGLGGNEITASLRAFALPGGHIPGRLRYYLETSFFDPRNATPIAEVNLGLPAGKNRFSGQVVSHRQEDAILLCDRNIYYYATAIQDMNSNEWTYSHVRVLRTPMCPQSQLGLTGGSNGLSIDGLNTDVISFNPNEPDIRFTANYASSGGDIDATNEMVWSVFGLNGLIDPFGRLTLLESSVGEYIRVTAAHRFLNMPNVPRQGDRIFLVTSNSANLKNVGTKSFGALSPQGDIDHSAYEARGGIFDDMQAIDVARNTGPIFVRVGEVTGDNIRDIVVATQDRILVFDAENYTGFLNKPSPKLSFSLVQNRITANEMILQDIDGDEVMEIIIGAQFASAKPKIIIYRASPGGLSVYREINPGSFGIGTDPYASNTAYQMKPVRYLPNRNELLVVFDGTENDPRGVALYNVNTSVRRVYYDVGPHVTSVSVSDNQQYLGLGLRTDGDAKIGRGYNNDLNSNVTKTVNGTLSRLILQDNGGNEFIELNNQAPPSLSTSGESQLIITDLNNSGGEEVVLAVAHPLGSQGESYVQVSSLAGTEQGYKSFGQNTNLAVIVDNLNNAGDKEIVVLDYNAENLSLFGPNMTQPADRHATENRNAFVSTVLQNVAGSKLFSTNMDNDPYKEILLMSGSTVKAIDSQVMNTQFNFSSAANNLLTDVLTADTNMDMAAEVILVTIDEIQVQKAAFDSNTPPIIANIEVETEKNTTIEIPLFAKDSDGDELTFGVFTSPQSGTVAVITDQSVARYTPRFGSAGITDTFFISVTDNLSASAVAQVRVRINGVPDPPQTVEQGSLSILTFATLIIIFLIRLFTLFRPY